MPNRRTFLQRLGAATALPVVGSMVLTDPYIVAGPSGLSVPDPTLVTADNPLVLATDVLPEAVAPIEAFVTSAQLDVTRMSLRQMLSGSLDRALVMGPAEVRLQLDLFLRSQILTASQMDTLFAANGSYIKLWVEPS